MKYAIIGDFHGTELKDLDTALDYENPDTIICTGDFDQTKTVHQFMDLEKKYKDAGKKVIKVPGNHDHAILNNLPITSGTLLMQGKTIRQLHEELNNDPVAKKYISALVNSDNRVKIFLDKERFSKTYQTIIIHGAYYGNLRSFPDCPPEIKDLWTRLLTLDDYKKNFRVMDIEGDKIMIRGHDHYSIYIYEDIDEGIIVNEPKIDMSAYKLYKQRKHVINPGALFNGLFAVINTRVPGEEVPILKYLRV